jgi:hypothetical protein
MVWPAAASGWCEQAARERAHCRACAGRELCRACALADMKEGAQGGSVALSDSTLGKAFAECYTRHRILGKHFIGKWFFAEYFFRTLGKDFAKCRKTLGKEKHSAN